MAANNVQVVKIKKELVMMEVSIQSAANIKVNCPSINSWTQQQIKCWSICSQKINGIPEQRTHTRYTWPVDCINRYTIYT